MGKKLCVVPMKYQYEQACNARFLSEMGVLVISDLVNHKKELGFWLRMENAIQIKYPDETRRILGAILDTEKTKPEKDSLNKIQLQALRKPVEYSLKDNLIKS